MTLYASVPAPSSPLPPAGAPGPGTGDGPPRPSLRVEWALVPKVDLLPREIIEAREFRRLQVRLAIAGGVSLLLAVVGLVVAQVEIASAQSALDTAQARTRALQAEQARYAEVPRVQAQLDAATTARQRALGTDVLWYRFLDDLAVATPDNVSLATVAVTMADGATVGAADPLTPSGLGTISFSGKAAQFPQVATWLAQVGALHGLDASRLQNASREDGTGAADAQVAFSTQIVITADALSHRYDRKAG